MVKQEESIPTGLRYRIFLATQLVATCMSWSWKKLALWATAWSCADKEAVIVVSSKLFAIPSLWAKHIKDWTNTTAVNCFTAKDSRDVPRNQIRAPTRHLPSKAWSMLGTHMKTKEYLEPKNWKAGEMWTSTCLDQPEQQMMQLHALPFVHFNGLVRQLWFVSPDNSTRTVGVLILLINILRFYILYLSDIKCTYDCLRVPPQWT